MELLMISIRKRLKLLGTIVPTTTRHRKIAGPNVWKKMLVGTRQIQDIFFYIILLSLSPLTIEFQHGYKRFASTSFSTKLPSWEKFNDLKEVKTCGGGIITSVSEICCVHPKKVRFILLQYWRHWKSVYHFIIAAINVNMYTFFT